MYIVYLAIEEYSTLIGYNRSVEQALESNTIRFKANQQTSMYVTQLLLINQYKDIFTSI